ncbi:MAG: ABC transporter substrate-binding protein [Actinomycetota bacterium]|nr:ABC transporter substrate-binding protein [Actinomycetota bacterium]
MSEIRYLDELRTEIERAAQASLTSIRRPRAGMAAAAAAFTLVLVAGAVVWLVRAPDEAAAPSTTTTTTAPQVDAAGLPLEWARVPQQDVLSSDSSFVLTRVTRTPDGFIAIGTTTEQRDGMVLISEDGAKWTRVDDASTFQGVSLQAVSVLGDVMAIAGIGPDIDVRFYTSTDGTQWDAAAIEASGTLEGVIPHAIAPHGDGFVAVGTGLTGDGPDAAETGVVWIADAEGTWREAMAPEFAASSLNDIVVVDGAMYVVGLSQIADGQSEPTIWKSGDDGATWTASLLPRIDEQGFAGASGIATSGGRWVAVGFEGNSGAVWTSDDGSTWVRYTPEGDEFSAEKLPTQMHDVLVTSGGIVVAGAESLGADIGRITWVSPDGSDWTRLDFDEPITIEGASPVAYSLAGDLSTIVAVGAEMTIEGESLGAVWVSPPAEGMASLVPIAPAGSEKPDDGITDPSEALPDGWLRMGITSGIAEGYEDVDGEMVEPSLNPFLIWDAGDIARLVVPGAYRLDAPTGELTPWIVERIPRLGDGLEVAADGTVTVTYTVRDEAEWEDGTPVSGEDLAFTHELINRYMEQLEGDFRAHELVNTDTMVVDGKSLTFELTTPDVTFERLFEWVLPAHVIDPDTFLDDWNDKLWPSAGPFRFVSWDIPTARLTEPSTVVLERNPNYWEIDPTTGDTLPYLEGIELHVFPGGAEPVDAAAAIKARELDAVLGTFASSWALPSYGDLDEQGLAMTSRGGMLYELMAFNLGEGRLEVNPNSRNDLLEYRQAVLSAIDRQALSDSFGSPAFNSIVGLAVDRYGNHAWSAYNDVGRAQQLLAGIDGPIEATYASSSAESTIAIGEAVADQLRSAGIDTTTQFGGDFFGSQLQERRLDLFAFRLFPGSGGLGQVAAAFEVFAAGEGLVDWTGLESEADRYTDLLERARVEFDQQRLAELLGEAESVLADNALVYPLVLRQGTNVIYWPDRIQGITPNRIGGWHTWNAAWWSPGG